MIAVPRPRRRADTTTGTHGDSIMTMSEKFSDTPIYELVAALHPRVAATLPEGTRVSTRPTVMVDCDGPLYVDEFGAEDCPHEQRLDSEVLDESHARDIAVRDYGWTADVAGDHCPACSLPLTVVTVTGRSAGPLARSTGE